MQIETLAVRLRPRSPLEAADLGVKICQARARQIYQCYAMVCIPVSLLSLAAVGVRSWLPILIIWWLKPWMDRTILFVLARTAFGQTTTPLDVWRSQRSVWWRQLISTLTLRRLSPWRSFTQPAYQLEGMSLMRTSRRVAQLRRGRSGHALLVTGAFSLAETALALALLSLKFWFAPQTGESLWYSLFGGGGGDIVSPIVATLGYACVVLFLEPFYVAAGFAMYLNRRTELEAWDIEQEFRRAFAH
jgi:hypothetical protein